MALTKISGDNALSNPRRRNLIINGDMRVNQRGFASDVDNAYTVDRFVYQSSAGDKFTITQDTDTPSGEGFVNSLKFVVASAVTVGASDYFMISQPIEGFNTSFLRLGTSSAKTFTLSFYVRSSLTGTFGGGLGNAAGNRGYPFTYTISSADTWEHKRVTVPGDTTGTWVTGNTHGLLVRFGLGVGSNKSGTAGAWTGSEIFSATGATSVVGTGSATWYITGVQLEEGSTASDFEHTNIGNELLLCQRYYHEGQYAFMTSSTTTCIFNIDFPTTMRATPTTTHEYAEGGTANDIYNIATAATPTFVPNGSFVDVNSYKFAYDFDAGLTADDGYQSYFYFDSEL